MLPDCRGDLSLRDEATELLQELIRLDTVNPPGNETARPSCCATTSRRAASSASSTRRMPERANLVARIPGAATGRASLSSRTPTRCSPTRPNGQVDPWSGEVRDGEVWGRGALDMKGQVAASAVAIASLAREGFEPAGDLIFVAAADEEVGDDDFGLAWLCEEHPDAVRADYSLNEGARRPGRARRRVRSTSASRPRR